MSQGPPRVNVPEEFRGILLDLTVSYLLEEPKDVLDFAIQHLINLKEKRRTQIATSSQGDDELFEPEPAPAVVEDTVSSTDDEAHGMSDLLHQSAYERARRLMEEIDEFITRYDPPRELRRRQS